MSMKSVISSQYRKLANTVAKFKTVSTPPQGWICTVRKALNLSVEMLASRLGVSRANIARIEKSEIDGAVTIKTMRQIAKAMDCSFIYAIVPNTDKIEDLIENQARKKAIALVNKTSEYMALEDQVISDEDIQFEIERLTKQLMQEMPRDLWKGD